MSVFAIEINDPINLHRTRCQPEHWSVELPCGQPHGHARGNVDSGKVIDIVTICVEPKCGRIKLNRSCRQYLA
jgi:hypothetical protein